MSSLNTLFRVSTYGESHCPSVGCIIDGVPPGLVLSPSDIQEQLRRRRPGQSDLTTPRDEKDLVSIQSGVECGVTLGTPICLMVQNLDQRPHDYGDISSTTASTTTGETVRTAPKADSFPRPSHADYTYLEKYGVKASSGGGRSSARETIGRVAAGAIAEKFLREAYGIEIVAFVSSVGKVHLPHLPVLTEGADGEDEDPLSPEYIKLLRTVTRADVDKQLTRCPDAEVSAKMVDRILLAKSHSDSIGGTVTCVIRNLPSGLGEPVFDKFEAKLAHAMLSIPATKGFEVGSGFRGCEIPGSRHNDAFLPGTGNGKTLETKTNWSGGIQGGITNGQDVYFRTAFKPPATISRAQTTSTYAGELGELATRGRHDPCVVPRAVPIVEAMAALVTMDMVLIQLARRGASGLLKPIEGVVGGMVGK